jgi:hypothetical protein
MTKRFENLFHQAKPIIAMAHIPALPGSMKYDKRLGIDELIEKTIADVENLEEGGVDAIMFCNEDDRPYKLNATFEQIAAMTRVITECRPSNIPFGVDFLWDPTAALAMAVATGAAFIREVFTGVYESDMGLWAPNAAEVMELRHNLGADHILAFFNVAPEFCSALGNRTVAERAKSAVVSSLADGILISGPMAGVEPDYADIEFTKEQLDSEVPVLLNTGAKASNIKEYLQVADGVIVGSSLKVDGYTWNPVELRRVKDFVAAANEAR